MYDKKYVLTLSFLLQAILFVLVGFGGTFELIHLWYFCSVFTLVGLVQSVDFPCLIGTIADWTTKRSRGIITGIWSTCSSLGNIVGLQVSVAILKSQGRWEYQMYAIAIVYFFWAVVFYFWFIESPTELGMQLKQEAIVISDKS